MSTRAAFRFWQRWLFVVSAGSVVFGLLMVFGSTTWVFRSYLTHLDAAFWVGGVRPAGAETLYRWLFAVLGSSIAAWGITLTYIAHGPFARGERWAHHSFLFSVLVWVVIDSWVSWRVGVYQEVMFNLGTAALVALPLWGTWSRFHGRAREAEGEVRDARTR